MRSFYIIVVIMSLLISLTSCNNSQNTLGNSVFHTYLETDRTVDLTLYIGDDDNIVEETRIYEHTTGIEIYKKGYLGNIYYTKDKTVIVRKPYNKFNTKTSEIIIIDKNTIQMNYKDMVITLNRIR